MVVGVMVMVQMGTENKSQKEEVEFAFLPCAAAEGDFFGLEPSEAAGMWPCALCGPPSILSERKLEARGRRRGRGPEPKVTQGRREGQRQSKEGRSQGRKMCTTDEQTHATLDTTLSLI